MKRNALWVAGTLAWVFAVFVGTFWLTFPSRSIADRLEYELPRLLGADYVADIGSVSPWWIGLSARDVKLYHQPSANTGRRGRRAAAAAEEEDGEEDASEAPTLVAMLSRARLRASVWSLFRRAPYVSGSVGLTDGEIDYARGHRGRRPGPHRPGRPRAGADQLPLSDLMMLLPITASGSGAIDLDRRPAPGDNGMRDATGHLSLTGRPRPVRRGAADDRPLGMEIPPRRWRWRPRFEDGRATIDSGTLDSALFQLAVAGEITLGAHRSSAIDITLTLSNLDDSLAAYRTFLRSAETSSGTYEYACRGVIRG
ncbi:MAG: type II secretion system protein GspN [Myxococcota bacterium]